MMRLFLVCACARALAPPGRTLVGGTWAGWQREFDVEGGAAPPGYELTSSERLDGDVLERSFVTPVERSTSILVAQLSARVSMSTYRAEQVATTCGISPGSPVMTGWMCKT